MEELILQNLGEMGSVGMLLAALFFGIRYVGKMYKIQQQKNEKTELEFREHLITTQGKQLEIIDKNTDAYKELIEVIEKNCNN